ncbi:MAG TPA: hypothetical protein VGV61_13920, partial [Thermoanaerobaculia bacterium]|nr:hypothetical protein [Thermoanaerobaculia bacterium]
VAIHGTGTVLPPGPRLRPGRVQVMVGEPIPTAGLPAAARDEVARQAEAAVTAMLARLASSAAPSPALAPPPAATPAVAATTLPADDRGPREVVV